MSGQTLSFEQKNKLVDDFIRRVNPYEKQPGLSFDLRGYSKYVEEHNIPRNNVPESVMKMFQR